MYSIIEDKSASMACKINMSVRNHTSYSLYSNVYKTYLPTYESQKTGHPATLGLVYAVPNLGTLRMVRVCILPSIMEGFKGLKFFTIS